MSDVHDDLAIDRRRLLLGGLGFLGAMSFLSPGARAALRLYGPCLDGGADGLRTLVLLQLSGGNDGLSTVVPYGDDAYNAARDQTRIDAKQVLKLDGYRGLHPELVNLRNVYDGGRLAIVEGVGYPGPVRSHFKALEIWHAAHLNGRNAGEGWISRLCADAWPKADAPETVVHVGANVPYSLYSTKHPAVSFTTPAGYRWVGDRADAEAYRQSGAQTDTSDASGRDAKLARLRGVLADAQASSVRIRRACAEYKPRSEYPADALGQALQVAASLIEARMGSRVISVELSGFDTHESQRSRHDQLMVALDRALTAFLVDVGQAQTSRDVVVLAFSEFGRRVKENGSSGTDHGVAGPMLVAGAPVKGGIYGRHPSLTELEDGDLVYTTDFRSVYATVVGPWFGASVERVLGERYEPLPLLHA